MVVKLNGDGFSEEHPPFEAANLPITLPEMPRNARDLFHLSKRDEAEIGVLDVQHEAFTAVYALWLRRHAEGMSKKDLADRLERDPAWVSRALGGPKNWTMRTLGELAKALGADVQIKVTAIEDLPGYKKP